MSLAHLLTDTVTVAARSGVSGAGDPTYGSQTTVTARVEHGSKLVKASDGREIQAEHTVLTTTAVGLQDRLWLPGDDTGDATKARLPVANKIASTPTGALTIYETYL